MSVLQRQERQTAALVIPLLTQERNAWCSEYAALGSPPLPFLLLARQLLALAHPGVCDRDKHSHDHPERPLSYQRQASLEANTLRKSCKEGITARQAMRPGGEPSERTDTGIGLRSLGKRARTYTLPGLYDPEKEIARMITFLFIFGLAAFLIVGGTRGSLHLRTHRVSTGRRLSGLRRSYAVPNELPDYGRQQSS